MTIVDKITQSIKAKLGQGFGVYYHDDQTVNVMTSTMKFPCAIVRLLTKGRIVNEGGRMKERVSAAVFFVETATEWDDDAVANEEIIDRCKRRGLWWLAEDGMDSYVAKRLVDTSRVYDEYDDIITGYGFFVDVTDLVGYSSCEFAPTPDDFNDDFNNDFNL